LRTTVKLPNFSTELTINPEPVTWKTLKWSGKHVVQPEFRDVGGQKQKLPTIQQCPSFTQGFSIKEE
jgi:hypothetical protein